MAPGLLRHLNHTRRTDASVLWVVLLYAVVVCYLVLPWAQAADGERERDNYKESPVSIKDRHHEHFRGKICIGTNGRMSVPSNRDHHYRNLRDRYTNCTYVDGNLELTWLQDENLDLSFLQHIREVTGYVLISHVHVPRIVLPSLQIIRGRTLFKLSVYDEEFALMVTLSKMHNLEMPALRDILAGNVGLFNNYNLCHVKTIKWDEIITGQEAKYVYVYNFTQPERECPACHESCEAGCWGEGPHNCQKFSKVNCSPQCHQGRCFGPNPRECCHLFCAGGCTGPKQSDCLACRNFFDDGVCKQECPAMQRYNPITYSWETNPEGKYSYGATCVKNCPEHLLRDNGACVRTCPPKKMPRDGECVPCDGPCPKTCPGVDVLHAGNIDSFKDCTVIDGSLTILDISFAGFQNFYPNFTFGARYPRMHPDRLDVFSNVKEVTGFINVQASHPDFKNLSYFRHLEVIGGRTLTEYFSSLYIVKTSLTSLGLRSLRQVRSGNVAILENKDMCLADSINFTRIVKSPAHSNLRHKNKDEAECRVAGQVCSSECSAEGCWGVQPSDCLSCAHYRLDDTCVSTCDERLGIYDSGNGICRRCHEECLDTCTGPGPGRCSHCKHVQDGPYCVPVCPQSKYNEQGVCQSCHENCMGGCFGPENNMGPRGCKGCEKAIINGDVEVERCLKKDEPCPDGYYSEWVGPQEVGPLKSLAGKAICRKCHPRCKSCTGYGFHESVCSECVRYKRGEQCEDECPQDHYADEKAHECRRCASECRGCTGPSLTHCTACRNYRIYDGAPTNGTSFNCTASCPSEAPHKIFPDDIGDPYCAKEPALLVSLPADDDHIPAILGGVLGCIFLLGVFLACFGYHWHARAKSQENTAKMTMVMSGFEDSEPLRPSHVKPNLAKLRIVKEAELRRGGILGYGAFGTVYKGVWVPELDNVKIPVAIKVLREGTAPGSSTNREILDEAYIMASVEHPNLLQLLAVCMTSQMMLVTQLMPLGCLLDYVRNNKDKIGSKPLLNWCTQIARGMAYLEERRLVHRDLAARNVLVQNPGCVKITDFGLAKLLDINEDEYKAAGGKMPIKWLALECIQHRVFTHKSDVWAFGVTVWELLTYGGRPYEHVPARDVPDLLEKGERLPQPPICTIDVYMMLIKCWMLDAESRPSFKELAEEFGKMARDPGRYLVIPGDKLMRLPSYTQQDAKELIRNLSSAMDGPEVIMDAEEYLTPKSRSLPATNTTQPLALPPQSMSLPPPTPSYKVTPPPSLAASDMPYKRSAHSLRYCSDPLQPLDGTLHSQNGTLRSTIAGSVASTQQPNSRRMGTLNGMKMELPVDEDDYLVPSPHTHNSHTFPPSLPSYDGHGPPPPSAGYMDLIGDAKMAEEYGNGEVIVGRTMPDCIPVGGPGMDNPEYHLMMQQGRVSFNPYSTANGRHPSTPSTPLSPTASCNNAPLPLPVGGGANLGIPISPMHGMSNGVNTRFLYPSLWCPGPNGPSGTTVANNGQSNPSSAAPSQPRSSEEESDHDYYNDCDGFNRELQPLQPSTGRRNETTV